MEIHFKTHSHNDDIPASATAHAQRKLIALKKYLREGNTVTQVYVELGKDSEAHQQGDVWYAQINLDRNGKDYHAKAHSEKLESAIGEAVDEIERELQKAKQKRESLIKRGGSAIKALLQRDRPA